MAVECRVNIMAACLMTDTLTVVRMLQNPEDVDTLFPQGVVNTYKTTRRHKPRTQNTNKEYRVKYEHLYVTANKKTRKI